MRNRLNSFVARFVGVLAVVVCGHSALAATSIAHWPFGPFGYSDISDNGYTLNVGSSATITDEGWLSLDGTASSAVSTTGNLVLSDASALTIEVWVNFRGTLPSSTFMIFELPEDYAKLYGGLALMYAGGSSAVVKGYLTTKKGSAYNDTANAHCMSSANPFSSTKSDWHHIALVMVPGEKMKLYIDGVDDSNKDGSFTMDIPAGSPFGDGIANIGSRNRSQYLHQSYIGGVQISSGAKTAAEILADYGNGEPQLVTFTVEPPTGDYVVTGSPVLAKPIVRDHDGNILTETNDYALAYENNVNPGEATVIVTGCGDHTGTVPARFTILSSAFDISHVPSLDCSTGFGKAPSGLTVTNRYTGVRLVEGADYTVSATNNDGIGTATAIVTGKGTYAHQRTTAPFTITATHLDDGRLATDDASVRMTVVDGKYVYAFTNAASAITVTARKGLDLFGYLLVGGGGGGGNTMGGGGGGGGVVYVTNLVAVSVGKGKTFTVQVGKGGTKGGTGQESGKNGDPTVVSFGGSDYSVIGGGGGGGWSSTGGKVGGSGGGGSQSASGGAGTEGLGYAGAKGNGNSASGGGGGAGGPGYQAANSRAGNGGPGVTNFITGVARCYGGGGGGGGSSSGFGGYNFGFGGAGGGGDGGKGGSGSPGVAGTGGGGGGAGWTGGNQGGGTGGSGVAILILAPQDFDIGEIPTQYLVSGGARPTLAVRDPNGGTLLVEGADYSVSYTNNTAAGTAQAKVTGIGMYAGKVSYVSYTVAALYRVKASVETEGDGFSWAQPISLTNAFALVGAATGPCELWLANDANYSSTFMVTLSAPLIVRGGFAGTETSLADRAAGAVATFDGADTVTCLLTVDSAAGADLTLERIKLCRAKKNGFIKTGSGGLSLYDCEISANGLGSNSTYGRGMNVAGGGVGTLVVSNCVYAGNRYSSGESNYGGFGIYATAFKSATIDDSLFVTNGFALNSPAAYPWCGYYTRGAAINMIDTPTTIRRSRFAGNCCSVRQSGVGGNWDGGTVFLQGKCGGSLIDHSEFVGNTDRLSYQGSTVSYSGALSIYLNAKTDKATVRHCTFAYNVTQGSASGGGMTVGQGVVDVENSIFWGNERSHVTTLGYGKDIQVHANGSVKIRYSLVSNLDGTAMAGTNLDYDDTVCAFDPMFVTSTDDYLKLVTSSASTFYYNTSSLKAMAEMDCHLLSTAGYWRNDGQPGPATEDYSPAIDRGNPASDYSREPSPNGNCVNLGVYGNTPEASKTSVGQPCATLEMTYPNNMTRPKAVVTMGLAEGSDYSAQVTLVCSTGGVTLAEKAWDGVKKTDVLELMLPFYAPVGAEVSATATIVARGATNVVYTTTKAAEGGVPAFFGKGGGSHVIHVRQGADCRMNGSDWTDAYPDLASAFKNAPGADKTEVWLSVTNDYLATTLTLAYPLTIRGGFNGTENAEAERAPGVQSVLSANNLYKNLEINIAAGQLLTIERLFTTKSKGSGIKKGGAGDLLIRECLFSGLTTGADGRCLFAAGGNVAVTNCLFVNNVGARESSGTGTGIYLSSCTHASVDDCLFATNGITFASAAGTWYSSAAGAGMYVSSTPTVIRNCRFAACGSAQRYSGDAGIVRFEGASGGSALTNVVIVGNGDVYSYQASSQNGNNGGLVVNMKNATDTLDVKNCTIAYNLTHGSAAAAGLTVRNGAVHVADSIIFGNIRGNKAATGFGADVHASGGTCQLEYCTVTALDETSLTGTALSLDESGSVAAADPLFVSSLADYMALLDDGASWISCKNANRGAHAALDVHLLSSKGYYRNDGQLGPATESYSPAIDTGNPAADYSREPMPNGGQVNQGAYGNTPRASLTSVGQPEIASGEVTFPNGMARPYVVVQLGIVEGTDFSANVEITCKTGEVVMAQKLFQGQTKTSRIEWLLPFYAKEGERVDALVRVQAKGAEEVLETFYGVAEGAYPIYYGKGGGPNVIHVRPGADCRMNGTDWTDAYPTLQAAFLNGLESGKTEVWLAVTNDYMPATLAVPTSLVFRGGFKGVEGSADAREPGRVSTINGNNHVYQTFAVNVSAGATVTVERVHFTRSKSCGVSKTGAGDFVLRDCQIYNNQNSGCINGRGLYVSGGVATVTNCQFRLNRGGTELPGYGCGIHLTDCTRATVDDCLFATNGGSFGTCQCTWSGQYNGSAAYVKNTKAVFRNCRFTAHGSGQRTTTDGGTVYFCGTSGGSALTNCTIIGNSDFLSYQNSNTGNAGGALVCALSSQAATLDVCNCTIAYNLTQGQYSSAGVNVISGTVNVRNSIIYGNVRGWRQSADAGADIEVKSGATLNLDYTLLTATNMPSISSARTLNLAPTCFTANPEFVTGTNDFYKLLTVDAKWYHLASGKEGACAALNIHLRGGAGYYDENTGKLVNSYRLYKVGAASPAIDAGDPASDFGREPDVRTIGRAGKRINLGAYGNTRWATMSPVGGSFLRVR